MNEQKPLANPKNEAEADCVRDILEFRVSTIDEFQSCLNELKAFCVSLPEGHRETAVHITTKMCALFFCELKVLKKFQGDTVERELLKFSSKDVH